MLRLQEYHVNPFLDINFVHPTTERNKQLESSRVSFLLGALSNRKKAVSLRIAAAEILLGVNRFHSGQQEGPARPWIVDNEWLGPFAAQLREIAQEVFEDQRADNRLRSLCLRFLPLDDRKSVADIKAIYAKARAEDLRFEIESYFLEFDQELYESLHAPGGPVSSLVTRAPERGCFRPTASNVAFRARYREVHGKVVGLSHYFALINLQTGQRFAPAKVNYLGGWGGVDDGESWFELSQVSDLSPGRYSLALQYGATSDEIHPVSSGYPATFSVLDTRNGRRIVLK